jgi:tRNA (cytidine/uridine-2'-O-)-methyltransferase
MDSLHERTMGSDTSKVQHRVIENPALHVVLHQPEIPANTGNVARLCGAAEIRLHLIHPLGFQVDDRRLKRAGLDYWQEVDIRHHLNFESFLLSKEQGGTSRLIAFSSHASEDYTQAAVKQGDWLLFGRETFGLPPEIRSAYPCYKIPIWGRVRSLNLATTVGIVVYHYLHQMGRF